MPTFCFTSRFLILQPAPFLQAASAVLAATMSPQIHPNGFRISDRPVATSFAHPYSFQPISDPIMRDEACLPSSVTLGGVEDQWVRYWDEGATVAKLEYEAEVPMQQPTPAKEKEKKKKKGLDSSYCVMHASDLWTSVVDVASAAPAEASALPVSDKPVTLSFKGGNKPTNLTSLLPQHHSIPRLKAFQVHLLPVLLQLLRHSDSL
jgi:RNA-binding protein 5/10